MNEASGAEGWLRAMRSGDFETAWRETDAMEASRRQGEAPFGPNHLRWDGSPFSGRDVLVRCLHGLGDTLQFSRFVPMVVELARRVTFAVQPGLLEMFPRDGSFGEICNGWSDTPLPHDVEIEVMELPYVFRVTAVNLPRDVPYLDREWIRAHSRLMVPPESKRPRIGLVWAASSWDPSRSVPGELLGELGNCEVDWVSLQQDASWPVPSLEVRDWSPCTSRMVDAAAAMLHLDLVVSVDAMPAHLAGALGVPLWLLLKHEADWRWMEKREDSPWYPTARLFRQNSPGAWRELLQQVRAAMQEFAARSRRP